MEDKKHFIYDIRSKDFILGLYVKYRSQMKKIAFSILNDWHEAEDAVEEAFIKIAKNYIKIINSKDYEIKKYIIVTVSNTSYKILDKKKANIYSDIGIIDEHSPPSACAEEMALSEISYNELKSVIDELSPRYKQILNMKNEGYNNKEIAEELNVKPGTIRVMLMRIRSYLNKEESMKKLFILSIFLILLMVFTTTVNASATPELSPMFIALKTHTNGLDIEGSLATCTGVATCYDGYTVRMSLYLEGYINNRWTTVSSWNGSKDIYSIVNKTSTVTSGNIYRVRSVATVYDENNKIVEAPVIYSKVAVSNWLYLMVLL